jgi:CheY-like chemotaxis protein
MIPPSIGHELRTRNLADRCDRGVHCRPDHGGECLSEIALASFVEGGVASAAIGYGPCWLPTLFIIGFSDDTAPSAFHRSHASRATVLIVDDDPSTTKTFAHMLKLEGYDVRTALDAETGLREAEVSHPDAILLDLRMPLVDGLAFLRRLRAREDQRQTPVAIVTGDYFIDDVVSNELRGLGADLHFKPLWLEDLVRITHTLVDRALPPPNSSSNH